MHLKTHLYGILAMLINHAHYALCMCFLLMCNMTGLIGVGKGHHSPSCTIMQLRC